MEAYTAYLHIKSSSEMIYQRWDKNAYQISELMFWLGWTRALGTMSMSAFDPVVGGLVSWGIGKIPWFSTVQMVQISQDWMKFDSTLGWSTMAEYKNGINNKCVSAYQHCEALAVLWKQGFDTLDSTAVVTKITELQSELDDVEIFLEQVVSTGNKPLYEIYMKRWTEGDGTLGSSDSGDLMAEVMIRSFAPLIAYNFSQTQTPVARSDSFLISLSNSLAAQLSDLTYGSLTVTINPSEVQSSALWRLTSGPDTSWKQSGYPISNIPTGSYTLEFSSVAGWTNPASRTIAINEGANTEQGTYIQLGGVTVPFSPIADTYVYEASPNQNYGGEDILIITRITPGSYTCGLIKFNLNSIPSGSIVNSVEIEMSLQHYDPSGLPHTVGIDNVIGSWSESNVNWINRPTPQSQNNPFVADYSDQGNISKWTWSSSVYPNLKILIEAWLSDPSSNNGLYILGEWGAPGVVFYSRNASDSNLHPKLIINYTPPPLPLSPSNLSHSNVSANSITWQWQDNSNNEDGFVGHDSSNNQVWTTAANSTNKVEIGLNPNTQYTRHVHAYNSGGTSSETNSHSVYTLANQPVSLSFSNITTNSIQANWNTNGNPVGTEYFCENMTAGTTSGWITDTKWNSTGLIYNTGYNFRVKARNNGGIETAWLNLGVAYTHATLPMSEAFSNITTNSIQANWNTNGNPVGTEYFCENMTAGTTSGWIMDVYWNCIGLSANANYSFRTKARNVEGVETEWTDLGSIYTLSTVPEPNSFSRVNCSNIQVNWTANGNPEGTEYYCENITNGTSSGWITDNYWNSSDLALTSLYSFRVKARNNNGVETLWAGLGSETTHELPSITSISPTSGPQRTCITIEGQNFYDWGSVVYPDGNEAEIIEWTDSVVYCRAPVSTLSGNIVIRRGVDSNPLWFTFTDPNIIYVDLNHTPNIENGTTQYPFGKIQYGIDAADPNDEVIIADGTYTGNGNRDIVVFNKPITVRSENGPNVCIINSDGSETDPHFGFSIATTESDSVILDGLTIINGYSRVGSGISSAGNTKISNCVLRNNYGNYGGAIFSSYPFNGWNYLWISIDNSWYELIVPTQSNTETEIINCVITNNSAIYGGGICYMSPIASTAIFVGPDIRNCTIVANSATYGGGIACYNDTYTSDGFDPETMIKNTIIWDNNALNGSQIFISENSKLFFSDRFGVKVYHSQNHPICIVNYCNIQGNEQQVYDPNNNLIWNAGNIDIDPLFADLNNGDYHLKSQAGRWEPNQLTWIYDNVTSPCIDAGDPNSVWTAELWPHGKRINMGAYGGTSEASMSLSSVGNIANLNNDVNDLVDLVDFSIFAPKWQITQVMLKEDLNRDGHVGIEDLLIFSENWLLEY